MKNDNSLEKNAMNDQLQDLLRKVYDEGVAKANAEADRILENAKSEAEVILAKANKQAEATIADARKEADALKSNTEGDIKMASNHSMSVLKQNIVDMLMKITVDESAKAGFQDPEFVKELIKEALAAWKESGAQLSIAQSMEAKMDEAFIASIKSAFNKEIKIDFSPKIRAGFTISPLDGSYKLSFGDEDFASLFKHYLRPRTAEILFEK